MQSVAFVGLGAMGSHMARSLLKKGFDVIGFDLSTEALADFRRDGGRTAETLRSAVSEADFVITMLPNDRVLETTFISDGAALDAARSKTLFIDCSTVSVQITKRIATAVSAVGAAVLDAPVSGGPQGARDATLTFMVGGDQADLERGRTILEAMGHSIVHMGDHGAGQAAKQCNNMLAATIMAATAEAIGLGVQNGLDAAALCKVMQSSSGGSNLLAGWNPWPGVDAQAPSSKGYRGGFQLNLMLKDLELAMDSARSCRYSTPMGSLARSLYMMCANLEPGSGEKDFSYIRSLFKT